MTGVLQERLDALERLLDVVAAGLDRGQRVPCLGHTALWLSEDAEEQEAAIHGCNACSALVACRTYVTEFPERAGTWAEMTPPQQKRAHRKELAK